METTLGRPPTVKNVPKTVNTLVLEIMSLELENKLY